MESEPMLSPREKSPVPEDQRRAEPAILHQAGQQAQHTTSWAILAPIHHLWTWKQLLIRWDKKRNCSHWWKSLLDPIWRLEWAQQTAVFCLCTGHCGVSAHLKRKGISDTSLCECEQADQTPNHVRQSCPNYDKRCQLTWPHGADLVTKLWGSAEDLCWTAGFVASARLNIWTARLSIAKEEEEEEEEEGDSLSSMDFPSEL